MAMERLHRLRFGGLDRFALLCSFLRFVAVEVLAANLSLQARG